MINFPNAKINIGLNITQKRSDAYHNIASVFYPIAWKDALEVAPSNSFSFTSTGLKIPGNTDNNLIIKAFELLKSYLDTKDNVAIHLHKVIPMGAGLGGGSADGAFALKLFNDFFKLELSSSVLEGLAAQLGSDCPFFIKNKAVYCYDRGIKFRNISIDLSSYYVVVVNPKIHISTAEAYSLIKPLEPRSSILDLIKAPIEEWKSTIYNDFEKPLAVKYPLIGHIKDKLYSSGSVYASMTGSGSTVYGIFKEPTDLIETFKNLTVWQGKML
ncbi:MAG: 4-diphosphocytidyl-2-C-methyl-D-erythritol kinase [Psychromonas sp.]|jgi:4-diphosphocytidyl-2-C-methyl-D-erythritol kinase